MITSRLNPYSCTPHTTHHTPPPRQRPVLVRQECTSRRRKAPNKTRCAQNYQSNGPTCVSRSVRTPSETCTKHAPQICKQERSTFYTVSAHTPDLFSHQLGPLFMCAVHTPATPTTRRLEHPILATRCPTPPPADFPQARRERSIHLQRAPPPPPRAAKLGASQQWLQRMCTHQHPLQERVPRRR